MVLRKQKTDRQKIIAKLDSEVSEYIRERDGQCVICGKKEGLTNGHLFSRGHYSLRWDVRPDGNCHCQCCGCNMSHEFDPYPFQKWYRDKFGTKRFDELYREWNVVTHFKQFHLEEMYERIKEHRRLGS